MLLRSILVILLVVSISGCATARKGFASKDDIDLLQAQMDAMKRDIQEKDDEIQALQMELAGRQKAAISTSGSSGADVRVKSSKTRYDAKEIQKALYNAEYYSGPIDGKIGKNTKGAIRTFQKDNGLTVDGVVGIRTWALLKDYLEIK